MKNGKAVLKTLRNVVGAGVGAGFAVLCLLGLIYACALPAAAQAHVPARSGQLLGALKRDASGKIVVQGPDVQVSPARQRQPSQGGHVQGTNILPPIAAQGFIHRQEAARFRRQILDAMRRARHNRRAGAPANGAGLSRQQVRLVDWLKARDREVRRHEAAHYRTGQPYTGAPVFEFIHGPDGRRYAISGQVSFRLGNNHRSAADGKQILRRLHAAALAPRQPSARDREIADALAIALRRWQ